MDCEKVIAAVKDMELQLLGVVHKISNGKTQEATVVLEKIARKTKCDALTLEFRNKKHMEQLQSLTEENKMLKEKLKYTETTKSKALQENGLLQVKLACKERQLEELKAKIQMLEKEFVNCSSQDIFNDNLNEDIANKSEESELEQEMTPKKLKTT
ncbi:hypothetical protein DPMN_161669 [Dreissena polymorpha]|uniref:Uncharacterized protein n=1 Tax=Dreissena polymorpha TaxID=45954 RepID=A0A9D4IPV6_DREPO|nr:hypothetical protein DPMN_161669 [Dreissena polymorpha]